MPRRMSTEDFIQRAQQVHGDRYDYSRVQYFNYETKVEIVCSRHGSFWQTPNNHLHDNGCPRCKGDKLSKRLKGSAIGFISKSKEIHGSKYDYSRVQYVNAHTKVEIVCPEHGPFYQTPSNHLQGKGCSKCAGNLKYSNDVFIQKAQQVHGDKYDYSKVEYNGSKGKIEIICPQHGSFFQNSNDHLQGKGCPRCFNRISRGEQELADSLKRMGLDVLQGYRKWHQGRPGLEIDIYLPDYSIGVEYNGEYWHMDREKDEEKAQLALQQGIRIITVWESEWKKDKDGVLENIIEQIRKRAEAPFS